MRNSLKNRIVVVASALVKLAEDSDTITEYRNLLLKLRGKKITPEELARYKALADQIVHSKDPEYIKYKQDKDKK